MRGLHASLVAALWPCTSGWPPTACCLLTAESLSFASLGVKEMTEGYNEAEFLVDYITEADRQVGGAHSHYMRLVRAQRLLRG